MNPLRRGKDRGGGSRERERRAERPGHAERHAGTSPSPGLPVTPIDEAPDRRPVQLEGSLRTVTLRPRGGVPALEAELADGSGTVTLVWLGRRRITGITAGCTLRVLGRVGVHEGVRIMYNPRYELIS